MLEHFSNFDVRNAQCTVSDDRLTLYDQIARLFDGIDETPISIEFGAPESFGELLKPVKNGIGSITDVFISGRRSCVIMPCSFYFQREVLSLVAIEHEFTLSLKHVFGRRDDICLEVHG